MADVALPKAPAWVGVAASLIRRLPAGRYRAANWIGSRRTDAFLASLADDLGALRFRCDLGDRMMREVCLTGRYEPQQTALVQQLLEPGMTFVDVGANWGYFTLVAAHLVGPTGRIISIEADPRACRTIRANVTENALKTVTVVEMAASDTAGTLHLQEYESGANDSGNFGLTRTTTVAEHGKRFEVAAKTLDAALDDLGVSRIDVLKMDIEGAEARAIAGLARRLSDRSIDRIVLEVHPQHLRDQGSSAEQVVSALRAHGYHAWKIDQSPSVYSRVGSGRMDVTAALTRLGETDDLGPWPHLLWTR